MLEYNRGKHDWPPNPDINKPKLIGISFQSLGKKLVSETLIRDPGESCFHNPAKMTAIKI